MSSRVYGDNNALERVKNQRPGDPSVYVNMEAIMQLPDEYEAHITSVRFDPQSDWDDVGNGNFMPQPNVYADIAIARGIEGTDQAKYEPIIEEIDINPMLCKPLEAEPTFRKMRIGYIATKVGFVLNEDGTPHYSDPCSASYNVWERCCEAWSKEEESTNGYDPEIVKNGKYHITRGAKSWDAYVKYDTKFKRKKHFDEEMKFAQRKADTKARHVVIRTLAGLKTGYKMADIKEGAFYFAKIRRSQAALKLEQAARLENIRNGGSSPSRAALWGPGDDKGVDATFNSEQPPRDVSPKEEPPAQQEEHTIRSVLKSYVDSGLVSTTKFETSSGNLTTRLEQAQKVLDYIDEVVEMVGFFDANDKKYDGALSVLQAVERDIPPEAQISHNLY